MRFIGRREGIPQELMRAHGLGRGADRRATTGSPCSSPSTTAAGPRSSTRREASTGRPRRSSAQLPLRARDARPRPADPHQRRAADLQLPALAVRLLGVRLPRRALARLRPRGLRGVRSTSSRRASAASGRAERRAGGEPVPPRPRMRRSAVTPTLDAVARASAASRAPTPDEPEPSAAPPPAPRRDDRAGPLGDPLDRLRDRDHRRRRDRSFAVAMVALGPRRPARVLPDDRAGAGRSQLAAPTSRRRR